MTRMSSVSIAVLFAVLSAGAVVWGSYRAEVTRAHAAASEGAKTAATSFGPIEYAETGSGMPLLSIHGAGGGFDQGIVNAKELVGDQFRITSLKAIRSLGQPARVRWLGSLDQAPWRP